MDARRDVANRFFEHYDFGKQVVENDSGWEVQDTHWKKTVYFLNHEDGDSIKRDIEVNFANESTMILLISNG